MSGRKATRGHRRGDNTTTRTRSRTAAPTAEAIENARLALLGVHALVDVLQNKTSDSLSMVLTRCALHPLRKALKLLGEEDADNLSWPGRLEASAARLGETKRGAE